MINSKMANETVVTHIQIIRTSNGFMAEAFMPDSDEPQQVWDEQGNNCFDTYKECLHALTFFIQTYESSMESTNEQS
jgi:hypothetical protein